MSEKTIIDDLKKDLLGNMEGLVREIKLKLDEQREKLISEFVEDLNHCYKYFTKLTLSNLIEKWEAKKQK